MKSKDVRITIRLSEKNSFYLSRLGLIDLRTGRSTKKGAGNVNKFFNDSLTHICESKKNPMGRYADENELVEGWIKYQIIQRQKEVDRLHQEMLELNNRRPEKKHLKSVVMEVRE